MKKGFAIVFVALLFFMCVSVAGAVPFPPVSSFEGGDLYKSGKLNVLNLHGTYRQMGRQYGYLLKDQLNHLYKIAIEDYFVGEKGLSQKTMKDAADALFDLYPERFKEILRGMAETSGMSLDKHIILNGLELYGTISACSGIAAWDDYTKDGSMVFGRNYDWFDSYREFAKYLTVTVLNSDSGIPCAIITFAGVIYTTTGINKNGLFLELNNGLPSGGGMSHANRVHAIINLLAFLTDCSSMEHLDAAFNSTRSNFTFIINVADGKRAYSYEWPPFGLKRRTAETNGLLVATNHFVDPEWGLSLMQNTGFRTVERRKNLLSMGHNGKGEIDAEKMMDILDVSMDAGGATWPAGDSIQTVYQIVAVPGELEMWLKVPDFQDWTSVNLASMFR